MNYWWASQNRKFKEEIGDNDGYLDARKQDTRGDGRFFWKNLTKVRKGDIVFSYVKKEIIAYGIIQTKAYDSPEGTWRADVKYALAERPIPLALLRNLDLRGSYRPLTSEGTGNQGYLFEVPQHVGRLILDDLLGLSELSNIPTADDAEHPDIGDAMRLVLAQARTKQNSYRAKLLKYWSGRCAVTGLDQGRLLRASHIKPFNRSDPGEHYSVWNGLLLSAAYDVAFDVGLISFKNSGEILVSPQLSDRQLERAGISREARISKLKTKHHIYLKYHRRCHGFEKGPA